MGNLRVSGELGPQIGVLKLLEYLSFSRFSLTEVLLQSLAVPKCQRSTDAKFACLHVYSA